MPLRERAVYLLVIAILAAVAGVGVARAQTPAVVPLCETASTSAEGRLQFVGTPQIEPYAIGTTQIGVRLRGRVVNTNTAPVNGSVTVTLFGADGSILSVLDGYLNGILPGQEVTIEALSPDTITTWARADVRWQMTRA